MEDAAKIDHVVAAKAVEPRRRSCTVVSLDDKVLVEAKKRMNAEGQIMARVSSMPNIHVMTTETEIRAPCDDAAAVQTADIEALTVPYVAMPLVNVDQQKTVVITGKTVKPGRRSIWSHIKKKC